MGGFLVKHATKRVTGVPVEEALKKPCKQPVRLSKIFSS